MSRLLATQISDDDDGDDVGDDEVALYDTAERGELGGGDVSSFDSFYASLQQQSEVLSGPAKVDFQERWGVDSHYDPSDNQSNMFGSSHDVPSGISSKLRRKLSCRQGSKKTRDVVLAKAIAEASQFSNEKIAKLKIASDMQVGLEIMHFFIIDLLG